MLPDRRKKKKMRITEQGTRRDRTNHQCSDSSSKNILHEGAVVSQIISTVEEQDEIRRVHDQEATCSNKSSTWTGNAMRSNERRNNTVVVVICHHNQVTRRTRLADVETFRILHSKICHRHIGCDFPREIIPGVRIFSRVRTALVKDPFQRI